VGEPRNGNRAGDDDVGDDHASTLAWIRWNARGSGRETTKKPRKNCGKITGKGLDNCHARQSARVTVCKQNPQRKRKNHQGRSLGGFVGWGLGQTGTEERGPKPPTGTSSTR
jgi:hypothetical protein